MEETVPESPISLVASVEDFYCNPHIWPPFQKFFCPLAMRVMKDPVALENGMIFERVEVEKWFTECEDNGREPICPVTQQKLKSTHVTSNIVLQNIIEEWDLRNTYASLRICHSSITSDSSVHDCMQALRYVKHSYKKGGPYKDTFRKAEMMPVITGLVKRSSRDVKCSALNVLCMLAEDDENKEALAFGEMLSTLIKFLRQDDRQEREEASKLLSELSKSESLSERIGETEGAILILIGLTSSTMETTLTVAKAEETLRNLEKSRNNVIRMAENGRLQPLLRIIEEGSPETRFSMVSRLGDLVLSNHVKVVVAECIGNLLVAILADDDLNGKEFSLKALKAISSNGASAKILISCGILSPLIEDLFATGNNHLPMRLKTTAAILADLVKSGDDFQHVIINKDSSSTLISEDVIKNLLHLINNSSPAVGYELLQVFVGLTDRDSTISHVVNAIKNSDALTTLIQFIEVPNKEICSEAIKLLCNVAKSMIRDISIALCRSDSLGKLLQIVLEGDTEEKVDALKLLVQLPDEDPVLVEGLLRNRALNIMLADILKIHHGQIVGSRLMNCYFEGLVLVITKITYVLQYQPVLDFAFNNKLAVLFAELLKKNGFDNVQIASAKALQNLSRHSGQLSNMFVPRRPSQRWQLIIGRKPVVRGSCKVHRGSCSLKESFCLADWGALSTLVACLDHANEQVVEAALAALSTLLEDGVDIQGGTIALANAKGVKPIVTLLINNQNVTIFMQALWIIERLLRTPSMASRISTNDRVKAVLIHAYNHGDSQTQPIAKQSLRWIEVLPP